MDLIYYNNPILRSVCTDVQDADESDKIISQLKTALVKHKTGVGLAAIQLGIKKNCFAIVYNDFEEYYINPKIIYQSEETQANLEGCLSLPGISSFVVRPKKIVISFLDKNFDLREQSLTGFIACIAQHEYDHMNGVLFFDNISKGEYRKIKKPLELLAKATRSTY